MDRCPYIIGVLAGDESWDLCELNDQICTLWVGRNTCDEWEEMKSEDGYDEYKNAGVMPGMLEPHDIKMDDLATGDLDTEENKEYTNKKEENGN